MKQKCFIYYVYYFKTNNINWNHTLFYIIHIISCLFYPIQTQTVLLNEFSLIHEKLLNNKTNSTYEDKSNKNNYTQWLKYAISDIMLILILSLLNNEMNKKNKNCYDKR